MSKQFWAVVLAIVVVVGGVIFFNNRNSNGGDSGNSVSASASNHTKGDGGSGVTLVEYGDFQCPACEAYYPIIEQVVEKYDTDITFQFRHFPLTSIHPNAYAASRAAEAASKQNKFFDMYNALYTSANWTVWTQNSNPKSNFEQYAQSIGLNLDQFNSDYSSSAVNDVVRADQAAGQDLGITGTPAFFLDGRQVANAPQDLDGWSKLIDAAIASKSAATAPNQQ